MSPAALATKKIRKFRLHARPSAVLRNLKILLDNAQDTPELANDIETEAKAAQSLLDSAALYATVTHGAAPAVLDAFWAPAPGEPAPVALTVFAVTIGSGLETELAGALSRGETFRGRVLTALGEELADQAATFVERLVGEEAQADACELLDRRSVADDATHRAVLDSLDAGRVGIGQDPAGHRFPRFTRVGVIPWGPPSKKKK
jgi:hypothetical protein